MSQNIEKRLILDVSKVNKSLADTKKSVSGLTNTVKNLGNTITTAFNNAKIVAFTKTIAEATKFMVKASTAQTEYIESLNLLDVAYGDVNNSGKKLINTMSDLIGLDKSGLTKTLATYRQLGSALNVDAKYADVLAENLLKMTQDVSSLYNIEFEQASQKLISAITGQSRAVKVLGADITDAGLQQTLYAVGINRNVKSLTQAEKTIVRYITLQKQLANAEGDTSRTINSVSNQVKIMREQVTTLGRQLGGFFIPILQKILPILNGILMTVNAIIEVFLKLLGIDATSMADAFGIKDTSDAFGTIAESIGGVESAAEKANKSLRGFDKLNNITTPDESASGGGVGLGIDPEMLKALDNMEWKLGEIQQKATKIRDTIMEWLGFTKDENGEWQFTSQIFDIIASNPVFQTIRDTVIEIIDSLKEWWGEYGGPIIKDLRETFSWIYDIFKELWNNFLAPIGSLVADIIKTVSKNLAPIIREIFNIVSEVYLIGSKLFKTIVRPIIDAIVKELLPNIAKVAKLIWEEIKPPIDTVFNIIKDVLSFIKSALKTIRGLFTGDITAMKEGLTGMFNSAKKIHEDLKKLFKQVATVVVDFISASLKKSINAVFKGIENLLNKFVNAINGAVKIINKIPGVNISNVSTFKLPQLADGGFVNQGEMFIAREAGPEMVGSIGNKTAVANNDQIVEAISVGVAKAMAQSSRAATVNIVAEGDASGLMNFISFKQKQENRQYGLG